MSTFGFFSDAGLTVPITTLRQYSTQGDRLVYFGSSASGKQLLDASSPGVAALQVSVVDSATGSGLPASAVKLAATAGGLASATGGAALSIGTSVQGGAINSRPIHIRVDTSAGTTGDDYTDLSLSVPNSIEVDV